jgi:hypothetical protein
VLRTALTVTYWGLNYTLELIKKISKEQDIALYRQTLLFNTFENGLCSIRKTTGTKTKLIQFCEKLIELLGTLLFRRKDRCRIGDIEINRENEQDMTRLLKNLLIPLLKRPWRPYDSDFGYCFFDGENGSRNNA